MFYDKRKNNTNKKNPQNNSFILKVLPGKRCCVVAVSLTEWLRTSQLLGCAVSLCEWGVRERIVRLLQEFVFDGSTLRNRQFPLRESR